MKASTDRILTSHAGSLPRPPELLAMNQAKQRGEPVDESAHTLRITDGVRDVVQRQVDVGLDIVNDGEVGRFNFLSYAQDRLTGFEPGDGPGMFVRRDIQRFADFYRELFAARPGSGTQPICSGPITYRGQAQLQADIDNFNAALESVDTTERS